MQLFALVMPYRVGDQDGALRLDVSARDVLDAVRLAWRRSEDVRPLLGRGARLSEDGPMLLLAPLTAA